MHQELSQYQRKLVELVAGHRDYRAQILAAAAEHLLLAALVALQAEAQTEPQAPDQAISAFQMEVLLEEEPEPVVLVFMVVVVLVMVLRFGKVVVVAQA